jgi:hypothetical protein
MAQINVYRYDFYDPVLKRDRRSVDYATGDAAMAMGAKVLSDTVQSVEETLLEEDGTIRAVHVFTEPPPSATARGGIGAGSRRSQ